MLHLDSDIEGEEFTSGDGIDTDRYELGEKNCGIGTDRNELGKENCNEKKCLSEITDDDIRAMEFSTEEEAIDFYKVYAHSQGFAIRKKDVKRNDENEIVSRRLLCNKAGKSERKNKKNEDRHRPTMRTGCLARLRVAYDIIRKIWKVTMFEPSHNHDLTPAHFVHLTPNYRKLSEADKKTVNGLHSQGVRTCHIMGFFYGSKRRS
ncbi:hypothetical protein TSUD_22070 [Trifolium subterraneum]|uniref:FAR1 domain-containing protein n=1 Tax=Trifolium subterraneum TaxID=3900 RepID=A0A2Z6MJE2_TRISU|nr:hypothetical protein TSUD_22070 [Trifolium subterraneum]